MIPSLREVFLPLVSGSGTMPLNIVLGSLIVQRYKRLSLNIDIQIWDQTSEKRSNVPKKFYLQSTKFGSNFGYCDPMVVPTT